MKKVASAIRITSWARAALHHRKEKVSIICGVLQIFSFSLTHAVCLVGWRASRVRLTCLHRLRLHPRMLFAAASRSVDARRPSANRTLWLPPVHQRPTSSAPSTACNSWRKAFYLHDTRRLPLPHRRTATSPNRRTKVRARCGRRRPGSSATGNSRFTRRTMALYRSPTSILGCMKAGATTITRSTRKRICAGRAAWISS